jgi:UDP-N-acetylmuramyl-tripeptide synthetase
MNSPSVSLSSLLRGVEIVETKGSIERPIRTVTSDSRKCGPGDLFVAVCGLRADGHGYVHEAFGRGAVACVVQRIIEGLPDEFTQVRVDDTRRALSVIASNLYGNPSGRLQLIGITGTNGKTTTAYLLESILKQAGHRVGVIGTVEYRYGSISRQASTTTPDGLELQRLLREMLDSGVTHVIIEVTSHGLQQHRVAGCSFVGGMFTNLSRDHLDYHGTMEAYLEAKARLFREHLLPAEHGGWAVLNSADPSSEMVFSGSRARPIWFGPGREDHFQVLDSRNTTEGIFLKIKTPVGEMELSSPLLGGHNVYNLLGACAASWALEVDPVHWKRGILSLRGVPGRFEPIENQNGLLVIVDYAHTPDALQKALLNLREMGRGRLICVFGCGGDRDPGKRPVMASVAARHCDLVVVTSDNPRTEDPARIIDDIIIGFEGTGLNECASLRPEEEVDLPAYVVIEDRLQAIWTALMWARRGDMVLIAGRGHEQFQLVGDRRIPFDDREVARRALEQWELQYPKTAQ